MALNATNDYITTEELNALAEVALSPRYMDDGTAQTLDAIDYPTMQILRRKKPGGEMQSVLGGYRYEVKGNRQQRINWWEGAQKLKFETHFTPFHLDYFLGKGHFGSYEVIDVIERAGIKVKYDEEFREGGVPRERSTVVLNILKENRKDIEAAIELDMARRIWEANTDAPNCFSGIDSLLPVTSNSTGTIGGVSRSLPILRHQLITQVTGDTVAVAFGQMERLCQDGNGGNGSYPDLLPCGDNWFDMLTDLLFGTTVRMGKYDWQFHGDRGAATAKASEFSERFRIGLPSDAFVGPGNALIYREPIFRKLDLWDAPATYWANRMYFLNTSHLMLLTEKDDEHINHGMPYDQRVVYTSTHMAHAIGLRAPASCGVMVKL